MCSLKLYVPKLYCYLSPLKSGRRRPDRGPPPAPLSTVPRLSIAPPQVREGSRGGAFEGVLSMVLSPILRIVGGGGGSR